jgi:RNA polymerase sigma factor (sigma-70 family)
MVCQRKESTSMANQLNPHDPVASHLIRTKASRLSRRRGFVPSDKADIEQELWLHLAARIDGFDPSAGPWECWASVILDRRCVSIWRRRNAEMRTPAREECSLDEPVFDADGREVPRHETTPEAANDPNRLRDLERDMAQVLAHLPDDLRVIALGLAFGTQNSVGPEVGVSRRAMTKAVEELREIFRDAGLDQYL